MYLGLGLLLLGFAWMLHAFGAFSDFAFGLVGGAVVALAGLLKILNLKRGSRPRDEF